MKPLIPFYLAITITSASILPSASPAKALTWNFSYESNVPFNYGTQSGTFEAPGSESDGIHNITQFQFDHSDDITVGAAGTFDIPNTPTDQFSTAGGFTNQITIFGGTVTRVSILVNNTAAPSSIAIDYEPAAFFESVDIFNNVDRTGGLIDQSTFGSLTFTPSSTAIPFDVNPLPAILLLTVGLGIERLINKKRSQKNYQPTKQRDESTKLGLNHEPTKTQASGSLESN